MTALRAEEHFESLREPVWARFRGRNPSTSRETFEDLWQTFWARELERAAAGRASEAAAPVAFVTEALQRLAIDDLRARARGVSRDQKQEIAVGDLDEHAEQSSGDDTAADGRYVAVVHAVLDLVRGQLSDREMRVFSASFLYGLSTPAAAAALGLSEARVKKDRGRILAKVGASVWPLLAEELGCEAGRAADLGAGFEVMSDHVEDCEACSGLRHGALAVLGPLAMVTPSGWFDVCAARFYGAVHRVSTLPPTGRGVAVAGLAAAAVAGGSATVAPPAPESRAARPAAGATPEPRPVATAAPSRTPAARSPRRTKRSTKPKPAAAPVATAQPPLRAPPPVATAPSAPAAQPAATAAPGEFGFERD